MVCGPTLKLLIDSRACPLLLREAVPMGTVLSLKVTEPLGMRLVLAGAVTTAERVTAWLKMLGFGLAERVVVLDALFTT